MDYAVTLEFDEETQNKIQAMIEAFAIVQEKFSAFGATAERIVLAKAEPYEELKSWELKEK